VRSVDVNAAEVGVKRAVIWHVPFAGKATPSQSVLAMEYEAASVKASERLPVAEPPMFLTTMLKEGFCPICTVPNENVLGLRLN
jgi:hypothetical protein